ncbi:phosphonate C-P lyase system protein PhnG [Motilimonas cestriensis]|uniref:Phosphonate C-P lyase system protein PhnG n=1 Tax=Motilimonas cestriensis TaxID=2742685 RepID=A0ABS8WC89_9GAMM|nr:phosphonate C-P lyase system protein PhnG [Motilimonas cestriensis]MCE2596641.1 phosphonate C-P lyase system protein PhnG [Motilimonas cestriensis]
MSVSTPTETTNISARQHWLAVIANAPYEQLLQHWQQLELDPPCEVIRQPEIGLARIQGRIGGAGERFNFADTTITRAAVRLEDGTTGYGYLQGRHKRHALLGAIADALLQQPEYNLRLQAGLIQPLAEFIQRQQRQTSDQAAATKVDFFTVVRGEDE